MRILIIEDDKEVVKFLKPALKSENFYVDTALNGEEGSFLARTNKYNLVILDCELPIKNGLEVCVEIRRKNKQTPILMLTVLDKISTKVDSLNAGADDYLTKPYSYEELLARIKALIRRGQSTKCLTLKINDLFLEAESCRVKRGKKEIKLTKKEFSLLYLLFRNKNKVVSRPEVIEELWEKDIDPGPNLIETYIFSLRKKIETPKKPKLIHTIPGQGYLLGRKFKYKKV